MLKTQQFLRQYESTEVGLAKLFLKYAIGNTCHPTDGRVILNYSQIDSPKNHEIVRECRGLVLDRNNNWELVARAFPRFFNWEEAGKSTTGLFKWDGCACQDKEDGSLAIVYFYNNAWHFNTRGSFGSGEVNGCGITWHQLFETAMVNVGFDYKDLNRDRTYIFELCSRYNKVVRDYPTPTLHLLSAFEGEQELKHNQLSNNECYKLNLVNERKFANIDEVNEFLTENAKNDPTFEGIVLRDRKNLRFKVKSIKYVELHKLNNNGNLATPKNLIKFILEGEQDEIIAYWNNLEPTIRDMEVKINSAYTQLEEVWESHKNIENQKEFAEKVLTATPFSSIMFTVRKTGRPLKEVWLESHELIIKKLF